MGLDKSDISLRGWLVPLAILAIALLAALAGEEGRAVLRFDRVWISEGETWRLASGHIAHLGWSHFLLNASGLLLVWFLVGTRFNLSGWWIIIAMSVLSIDLGLWFLNGELIWYVGLSGLLHGLLAAGIVAHLRTPDGETLVLAALMLAKLAWEQFAGPVPGSVLSSGGPVVVDAHLYGAVGGILGAMLLRIRVRTKASI